MPDSTLFDATAPVQDDPSRDYLSELVGEDRKYKTSQDLAKSRFEADAFIEQLKQETKGLRDELSTRIRYEEFIEKLDSATLNRDDNQTSDEQDTSNQSVMNPEALEQLLEKKLRERDLRSTATQNLNEVKATLSKVLGPNYALRLKEQANQLEVSEEFINNLAATRPKALYRLLNIDGDKRVETPLAPPRSQTTFAPQTGPKRDWDYYSELRKKDSRTYWSPKIQNEIFELTKAEMQNS